MSDYLSVSALTKYIKYKFDQDPHLQSVLIKGELSNFKKHSSGHLYFNVKDKESVISAMMFKGSASKLNFEPKEGDEVLLEARVSVFERRGNYQIYVNKMQLDGIGNLYQKLEALKKKLTEEGCFDKANKKSIPKFPKKIAVLTASTGVDTIIVGRGGGSIEDLWNFNEEAVVRAIYNCKTPIISAVGHETDFTLSDFAADIRAATPTQAAVIATPDQYELLQQIQQYQFTLTRFIKKHLEQQRKHVEHLSSYYKFKQPTLLYDQQIQRRDDLEKRLKQQIQATFEQQRHRLMLLQQRYNLKALLSVNQEQQNNLQLTNQLVKLLNSKILSYKNDLKNKVENLNNLSPTNTMLRGYAIVNKKDEVITSTKDLTENDQLTLTMKDGLVDAKVTKVRCNND